MWEDDEDEDEDEEADADGYAYDDEDGDGDGDGDGAGDEDDDADDDDDEDELVGRNQGGADNCGQTNLVVSLADQSEPLLSKPVPLSFQPLNWSTMSLSSSSQAKLGDELWNSSSY